MSTSNQHRASDTNWSEKNNVSMLNRQQQDDELHLVCLEERVLYSAVPMPVDLVEYVESGPSIESNELTFDNVDQGLNLIENGVENYFAAPEIEQNENDIDLTHSEFNASEVGQENLQIIFVDQSVEDYQDLVDDILNQSSGDIQFDIAFINGSSSGIQQVTSILNEQTNSDKNYHAVHLVTHGSNATVNLGNTQVDGTNIHNYASDFVQWQNALSEDADILIYGCEVGETEAGKQFVQELADLTGADVAASDDLTGHSQLGGDWDFEVIVGVVETENVFSSSVQATWMHTLAGEETTGESGTATGNNLAINDSQTVVQVFAQDQGLGDGLDIFYQVSDGNGVQSAVQVNTADASGTQQWASVAIDNDGDFVVVWTDDLGAGEFGVFAKYFASDGSIIRDEFRVDPIGSGGNDASVAIDADGNFVVAWEGSGAQDSDGIYAQRFDAAGATVGSTFLVNDVASAGLTQGNADVAINDSGQFVIVWDDYNSPYYESDVFARVYDDSNGFDSGEIVIVDSSDTYFYFDASVSINNLGNIAIATSADTDQYIKDGGGGGTVDAIAAATANSAGAFLELFTYTYDGSSVTEQDRVFDASESWSGDQVNANVTILENDEVILTWEGRGTAEVAGSDQTDEEGVFFRKFDLQGNALTGETFINENAVSGVQSTASVASNGSEFVFGYNDQGEALTLEASFNYAPVSENSTLSVTIGFGNTLSLSDFSYFDAESELLDHIVIDSVPVSGTLMRNSVALSATDTITRAEIENGDITFQPNDSAIGIVGNIVYRTNDGTSYSNAATIQVNAEYSDSLLIGTKGTQTLDSVSWDQQDIVALGGSDFALGDPTTADAFLLFESGLDLDAFHVVNKSTSIPTDPAMVVEAGDILFSITGTDNITGVGTTNPGDILLFKPGSPGDYDPNTGSFSLVATIPSNADIKGITLVEDNTTVGDFELQAGDILFTHESDPRNINRLTFISGSPNSQIFIDGSDIGITDKIYGLELVEQDATIGGTDLTSGTILLSLEANGTVAATNVQDNDIASLVLSTTNLGSGSANGSASVFFDGSTVTSLSGGGNGDVTGISLQLSSAEVVVQTNTTVSVIEGFSTDITSAMLEATDPDNTPSELSFTIASGPSNGEIHLSGNPTTSFTQKDINDGLVTYKHDGSESTNDSVNLQLSDGVGTPIDLTLDFNVQAVNDSPVLITNSGATYDEGSTGNPISSSMLSTTDVDDAADQVVYTLDTGPTSGQLLRNNVVLAVGETFTQQDVIDGLVTYNHDGSETNSDSFEFTVADGGENGASSTNDTFSIAVNSINDEQTVVSTVTPIGVSEGNAVTLTSSALSATDVDNNAADLIYTISSGPTNGIILVNGSAQSTFTQDDINNNRVAYSHYGNESTSDSILFTVDDGIGSTSNASLNFTVTPVNDSPVLVTNNGATFNEGTSSNTISSSMLSTTDVDDAADQVVYTLDTGPTSGQLLRNNVVLAVGETFTQQDVIDGLVTYNHDGSETNADSFEFTVADGGENGSTSTSQSFSISIAPVNDEQVVTATSGSISVAEGNTVTLTTSELTTTDVDNSDTEIVYTVTTLPANGSLLVNGTLQSTFTQADLANNLVVYQHNGSETTSDVIQFSVDDGGGATSDESLSFSITPVNDAFSLDVLETVTIIEGSSNNAITTAHLSASDVDDANNDILYEVTVGPAHGQIFLDGTQLNAGDTFSQQDVLDGRVTYDHDGSEFGDDQISLNLMDGLEDGVTAQSIDLIFNVTGQNDPISDLNAGVEINTNGDDVYFRADDGDALFGGKTELTYEVTIRSETAETSLTLASYRTPSDVSNADDAFRINVNDSGDLVFSVNGESYISNAIDYWASLTDGSVHSVALSWQSQNGNWEILIDGQIVDNGNGVATGQSIRSGGIYVFGNEQDSVDGAYSQNQEFSGQVFDIRIWDQAQSAFEINQNFDSQFEPGNLPDELLANWQFSELQGGTTVTDVVADNDLTLQRIAGFNTSEATAGLQVSENATNGTSVGFVVPTDSEFHHDISLDGSFTAADEPTGGGPNDFDQYNAGSFVGAWEVTNNGIDLRGESWERSPLGGRALDLTSDDGQGTIQQTLATVPGESYTINFALTGNFEGSDSSHTLNVNVDGASTGFTFNEPAGWSRSNLQWETRTLSFTATSTSTVLQFEGTSGSARGAMISDVAVVNDSAPAVGALNYNLTDDAGGRFSIDSTTGEVSVANSNLIDFESNISHAIQIEVQDEIGQTSLHDMFVSVSNANDAPQLLGTGFNLPDVSVDNTDPPGTSIADMLGGIPATAIADADSGALTGIAVVGVDDSQGQWQFSTDSGTTWNSLAVAGVSTGGTNDSVAVFLDESALVRFVPDAGSGGPAGELSFRAWDQTDGISNGSVGDATFTGNTGAVSNTLETVSVSVVNTAPVVNDDAFGIVPHNSTQIIPASTLLANDFDAENGALTITAFTQPTHGVVTVNGDGDFVFTPDSGFSGPQTFTYTVSDGRTESIANVDLIVNDLPSVTDDSFTVGRNSTLNQDVSDDHSDNYHSGISYELVDDVNNGSLLLNADGTFTYTPDSEYFGSDSFTYVIDDGYDQSAVATVNITVTTPPTVVADNFQVNAGESVDFDVFLNDYDDDDAVQNSTIQVEASTLSGGLRFDATTGIFTYDATDPTAISDSFEYKLLDGDGQESGTATVTIAINHAPDNVTLDNDTIAENSAVDTVVGEVDADDLNDDVVSFQLQDSDGDPTNNPFKIDTSTGVITVDNSGLLDFENSPSFSETVIVTDASGLTTMQTFTINLTAVDDEAPVLTNVNYSVDEGGTIRGDFSADTMDVDSNRFRYSLLDGPSQGTLDIQPNGNWRYTHDDSENFTDQFRIEVRDMNGNTTTPLVTINVNPVDDAPVAVDDNIQVNSVATVDLDLFENDVNIRGNPVIEIVTQPTKGEVVINPNGSVSFAPYAMETGSDFFEYQVTVGGQTSSIARANLEIVAFAMDALPDNPARSVVSETNEPDTNSDIVVEDEEESDDGPDNILQGPIVGNRANDASPTSGNENERGSSDLDFLLNEQDETEIQQERHKTLLWQPRYANYGRQIAVEATLSELSQTFSDVELGEDGEATARSFVAFPSGMMNDLEEMSDASLQFSEIPLLGFSASGLMTVTSLVWVIRAGAVMSMFTSGAVWTQFDPLPVIEKGIPVNSAEEDDSLEKLVDTV